MIVSIPAVLLSMDSGRFAHLMFFLLFFSLLLILCTNFQFASLLWPRHVFSIFGPRPWICYICMVRTMHSNIQYAIVGRLDSVEHLIVLLLLCQHEDEVTKDREKGAFDFDSVI